SHRANVLEVKLPPQKRLCIALGPRFEVDKTSYAPTARPTRGYGITDTWDEMLLGMPGALTTDETGLGRRMTNFVTTVRQDTNESYGRLDDAQDDRALISEWANMLIGTSIGYYGIARRRPHTTDIASREAKMAKKVMTLEWVRGDKLLLLFERMETVFRIRNCTVENQIKFATCTLLESALTWCNSHVTTVGPDVAYAMTWTNLRKKMTDKYCSRGEINKLEGELWNLRVKSNNVVGYNQHFQELAFLCVQMFLEESDKVERYVGGFYDVIHRSVVASRLKTMQEAIKMATELMDIRNNTFTERQAENR
nr:reverse transcriptase domain-containing protein [Tanacetum cinerariifolium]